MRAGGQDVRAPFRAPSLNSEKLNPCFPSFSCNRSGSFLLKYGPSLAQALLKPYLPTDV
jgi:hypothetical protein